MLLYMRSGKVLVGAISWTVLGAHTELKDIRVPTSESGDNLFFK